MVLPGDTDTPPLRAYEDTDASSAATGIHPKAASAGGRSGVVCSTCNTPQNERLTHKMRDSLRVTDLCLALQGPEAGGHRGGEELLHQHGLLPPQEAVPPLPHQLAKRRWW